MYQKTVHMYRPGSGFGRRADQPEIAPGADLRRWPRLEVLAQNPLPDLEHHSLDPLQVVGRATDRDLLVGEDVPVAAGGALEAPCLTRGEPVDRELHVGLELPGRLRIAGLVVDQLVPAAGQLVDAVAPPAQVMRPDPEVELALDPSRVRAARDLAGVVAVQCLDRLL